MKVLIVASGLAGVLVACEASAQRPQSDGGAVVADAGGLFVRTYDRGGALTWRFGRGGDGLGEFRAINGVWEAPTGEIGVWDGHTRRLTFIDHRGALARTAPVNESTRLIFGPPDRSLSGNSGSVIERSFLN